MKQFNPKRLKEARLYRKFSLEELGEAVGITRQAVSQFENEKSIPEFETLLKISRVLNFNINYFLQGIDDDIVIGNTYFRALFSSNKKDLVSQEIKAYYVARVRYFLSQYVDFPRLNLPTEELIVGESIDEIANNARDFWGLGRKPIHNMISLMEQNGVVMTQVSSNEKIDAFYQYSEIFGETYYTIVLGTEKYTFVRRQFSVAHELGHILLHEENNDLNDLDRKDYRKREEEANSFASAFLMPKDEFIQDAALYPTKLNHYKELKKKWKVSIGAMIKRSFDLELISSNQYQYLQRQISAKGWKNKEPLDDYFEVIKPQALPQSMALLLSKDGIPVEQMFHDLQFYEWDIPKDIFAEIANIPLNVLEYEFKEESDVNVIPLNFKTG